MIEREDCRGLDGKHFHALDIDLKPVTLWKVEEHKEVRLQEKRVGY